MGRTVLVTGASGGIGAAVAGAFAAQGDAVALGCHHNLRRAEALCGEIGAAGGRAMACAADVADPEQVDALFTRVEAAHGPVQVLVNCAGAAQQKQLQDITDADWRRMMGVHADGTFYCCRRALPAMLAAKSGCIVNITSMWGQVGAACEAHYSAAKAAVIGLSKAMAKELGPSGIRVNCVAPGAIETAMLGGFSTVDLNALAAETPLGRLGTPAEVAAAVVFLASVGAGFITGQVLAPNGGLVV